MTEVSPILVDLEEVNLDPGPCCMSYGFDLGPLTRSIEKFGLINTPLVTTGKGGKKEIVIGYRRMLAMKALKRERVSCRDLSGSDLSPLQRLLMNLYDNLTTRQFNDVEKGLILNRLSPYVPAREMTGQYMPLLGLPAHEQTLDIFLKLESLEDPIKTSLVRKAVSFPAVRAFMDMDKESREVIFEWVSNLNLNFNQQLQFIEYTLDISNRDRLSVSQLLREKALVRIREDGKLNRPQKSKKILTLLRSKRLPSLSGSEKAFQKKISELGLPGGVSLHPPPFFEGPEYRLEIRFKEGEELRSKIDALYRTEGLEGVTGAWREGS